MSDEVQTGRGQTGGNWFGISMEWYLISRLGPGFGERQPHSGWPWPSRKWPPRSLA